MVNLWNVVGLTPISTFPSPQEQVQYPLFTLSYMIKMQLTAIERDDANT